MIEGTEMEKDDCTTIVLKAHKAANQPLFNNAAQVIFGMLQPTSNLVLIWHGDISASSLLLLASNWN